MVVDGLNTLVNQRRNSMKLYDNEVNTSAFVGMMVWMFFVSGGIVGAIIWSIVLKFALEGEPENPTRVMLVTGFITSLSVTAIIIMIMM